MIPYRMTSTEYKNAIKEPEMPEITPQQIRLKTLRKQRISNNRVATKKFNRAKRKLNQKHNKHSQRKRKQMGR